VGVTILTQHGLGGVSEVEEVEVMQSYGKMHGMDLQAVHPGQELYGLRGRGKRRHVLNATITTESNTVL